MDNKNAVGTCNYADILQQTENLLNCSYQEIKSKYEGHPHCEISYFEEGLKDKSIEVRFDDQELTMTCIFNSDSVCKSIFLFPDKEEVNHKFIAHLTEVYEYDFINMIWIDSGFYIKIKRVTWSVNDVCFMVSAKK